MSKKKIKLFDISEDDIIIVKSDTECLEKGSHYLVFKEDDNRLYIECEKGKHYLDDNSLKDFKQVLTEGDPDWEMLIIYMGPDGIPVPNSSNEKLN